MLSPLFFFPFEPETCASRHSLFCLPSLRARDLRYRPPPRDLHPATRKVVTTLIVCLSPARFPSAVSPRGQRSRCSPRNNLDEPGESTGESTGKTPGPEQPAHGKTSPEHRKEDAPLSRPPAPSSGPSSVPCFARCRTSLAARISGSWRRGLRWHTSPAIICCTSGGGWTGRTLGGVALEVVVNPCGLAGFPRRRHSRRTSVRLWASYCPCACRLLRDHGVSMTYIFRLFLCVLALAGNVHL